MGHQQPDDEDDDLYLEAGLNLLGRHFVTTELIFNRLDVLLAEWRALHGLKK